MDNVAIIDLGTNTFHLLIVGLSKNRFFEIYRERVQVYMAEDGIDHFGNDAFQRALDTLDHYNEKIKEYNIERVTAFATAGFRKAGNSIDLQQQIYKRTGIKIEVISGEREAELIFKGVQLAIPLYKKRDYLIMDIGGGSVEFIIVHKGFPVWSKSFDIGVAILFHKYHQEDPIPEESIRAMEQFLDIHLQTLLNELKQYKIAGLLGASGSFEVLEGMVGDKEVFDTYSVLETHDFSRICEQLIKLNFAERLKLENLPENRANLVVAGILLMRFILRQANIEKIYVSQYAIKEGMISEFF